MVAQAWSRRFLKHYRHTDRTVSHAVWTTSEPIRDTAVYAEHLTSFDIPIHLSFATRVYIAKFGIMYNRTGELRIHLKVGKAVEQPVTYRVRDHHNERPRTFQLT